MGPETPRDPEELLDFLMQVGHALNLVCELPEWLHRAPLPKHLRHAAAESFLMNCRLLDEFLRSASTFASDIRATSYCGDGWSPNGMPEDLRELVNKHVVHMTRERVEEPLVSLTYGKLVEIRQGLLGATDQFADAIIDERQREQMKGFVRRARTLAEWPPAPTEGENPAEFIEAITHLDSSRNQV